MKKFTKKIKFNALNKGNKFFDYVCGHYHLFIRCDDVEEKDVNVWNAVDIETGDFFHYDSNEIVEIPLNFYTHP